MSAETVEIKLFTVKDLRAWLYKNQVIDGLTASVVTKCRAEAIVNNPYVKEDDPVAAAIYDACQLAAYTASFPDEINGERVWWFSSLWCHEAFQGQGYPLIAIGSLCAAREGEAFFDMWGAEETVGIFNYLGLECSYFEEYVLSKRFFSTELLKNRISSFFWEIKEQKKCRLKSITEKIAAAQYEIEYVNFIDEELYAFIKTNAKKDLWTRSREMMNWIMAYSFIHQAPLSNRVDWSSHFSDNRSRYWRSGVKVIEDGKLVGFFMIREATDDLSLKYIYYIEDKKELVFEAVMEHIVKLDKYQFSTRNKELRDFVVGEGFYDRQTVTKVSFSHPDSFRIPQDAESQGGDGDGFV